MSFVKIHSYKDQRFKFALGIQVNKSGLIINRITLNMTIHQINGAIMRHQQHRTHVLYGTTQT